MRICLVLLLSSGFIECVRARFAYEKGHCEIAIFNVVQQLFNREVSALINPRLRSTGSKRIRWDLYTPLNPFERQQLSTGNREQLLASNFNPKLPLRVSIHGWTGKSTSCSNAAIKDAYMAVGQFNVIIMDWSDYSMDISYSRITKQMPSLAASLVKFLRFLQRQTGIPFSEIYLIGHSAGSHISGLAGKMLKSEPLGAIYGLDPAGLNQLGLPEPYRLAASDARYVESIHTDITLLGNPSDKLSHAAFFPNWGQGQPHCPNATAAEFDFACDHFAAIYYFANSLHDAKSFGAIRCKNARSIEKFNCGCADGIGACAADAFMGGEPAAPKRGVFYLSTNDSPPYGRGEIVRIKRAIASTSTVLRQRNSRFKYFITKI